MLYRLPGKYISCPESSTCPPYPAMKSTFHRLIYLVHLEKRKCTFRDKKQSKERKLLWKCKKPKDGDQRMLKKSVKRLVERFFFFFFWFPCKESSGLSPSRGAMLSGESVFTSGPHLQWHSETRNAAATSRGAWRCIFMSFITSYSRDFSCVCQLLAPHFPTWGSEKVSTAGCSDSSQIYSFSFFSLKKKNHCNRPTFKMKGTGEDPMVYWGHWLVCL